MIFLQKNKLKIIYLSDGYIIQKLELGPKWLHALSKHNPAWHGERGDEIMMDSSLL